MLALLFSNSLLSAMVLVLLVKNNNWHFRSLLMLILASNIDSILRHSLIPSEHGLQILFSRLNVLFNIGIGYFGFLMFHDAFQHDFRIFSGRRLAFIRYLTLLYALLFLYFLTQDNFILSMISYGLPVVLMFLASWIVRPIRWMIILGSAVILGASGYLALAPPCDQAFLKPGDIYHYLLGLGLILLHRAYQENRV